MAKDEPEAELPSPSKSKKMLIIIAAALVLVLVIGGGAAYLLMGGKAKKHGDKENPEAVAEEEHGKPPPTVAFEEKFTVNLQSEDGTSHYLQVPKLELEMADEASAKKVEERKAKVSDRINSALRSKTVKDMLAPGSDLKLKEELKKVINDVLEVRASESGKKGVKEVILPASFIVQ